MFSGKSWEATEKLFKNELDRLKAWAEENTAKLNLRKTKLVFVNRRSQAAKNFECPITKEATTLGITFDDQLNFARHVSKTVNFFKIKSYILAQLRTKLQLSTKCLTSIYKCYRNQLLSSGFFTLLLSDYQFNRLSIGLNKMTKCTLGFSKLVPVKVISQVCGTPTAEEFVSYWSALRRYEYKRTQYEHLFEPALRDRTRNLPKAPRLYSCTGYTVVQVRPSTVRNRNEIEASKTCWPARIFTWIEKSDKAWRIAKTIPNSVHDHKKYLKNSLFDREIHKIHNEITIRKIVSELNEKYYTKFVILA